MLTRHRLTYWVPVVLSLLLFSLLGCDRDLGECNLDGTTDEGRPIEGPAALDLAFRDSDGVPMYEGQALVQSSCGNGGFCHSPDAIGGLRHGVPAGLNFDVNVACIDTPGPCIASVDPTCANPEPCEGASVESDYCKALRRLEHNRGTLVSWAGNSISEIRDGTMPPGAIGATLLRNAAAEEVWLRADDDPLPEFGTAKGQEIIRNWLACAAPVVARTVVAPSPDLQLTRCASIEDETCIYSVPRDVPPPPEPTWSAIYWQVIFPQCVNCHGAENDNTDQNPNNPTGNIPGGDLDSGLAVLDLTGSDTTDTSTWAVESHPKLLTLETFPAPPGACGGGGRINVIPGDAAGSLMIQKMLEVQDCGGPMPLTGPLVAPVCLSVIELWIDDGALNN